MGIGWGCYLTLLWIPPKKHLLTSISIITVKTTHTHTHSCMRAHAHTNHYSSEHWLKISQRYVCYQFIHFSTACKILQQTPTKIPRNIFGWSHCSNTPNNFWLLFWCFTVTLFAQEIYWCRLIKILASSYQLALSWDVF